MRSAGRPGRRPAGGGIVHSFDGAPIDVNGPDWNSYGKRQLFQLHPGGWYFKPGHHVRLELLTSDAPYSRPSQGQTPMTVSKLDLRLPTLEKAGDQVLVPMPKSLPAGYKLAPDFR